MRGVPGSGKTPWAVEQFGNDPDAVILSSADFFMKNGRYNWIAKLTPNSHAWNQERFSNAIQEGKATIIVDNTNIKAWEMQEYLNILEDFQAEYEVFQKVMEVDLGEAIRGSIHKVPDYAIIRMDEDFEELNTMGHFNSLAIA